MTASCQAPHWIKESKQIDSCRNAANRTCTNCGIQVCWRHIKLPCPQGRVSEYGRWQHLTLAHAQELDAAEDLRMNRTWLASGLIENAPVETLAVEFSYRPHEGETGTLAAGTLVTHLGEVHRKTYGSRWTPGEDLMSWLETHNREGLEALPDRGRPDAIIRATIQKIRYNRQQLNSRGGDTGTDQD